MPDIPLLECAERAQAQIMRGATVHQKWNCSHCGTRQTMERPNAFFTQGICEECGKLTDILECGFSAMWSLS